MPVLWVRGLKKPTRDSRHPLSWQRVALLTIAGHYDQLPDGPKTRLAEANLGIERSVYWFVARAEGAFGYVVFLSRCSTDCPAGVRGACAFDSGGLWHDEMPFNPILDVDTKRALFLACDCSLADWLPRFKEHVARNYKALSEYVAGIPPRSHPVNSHPAGELFRNSKSAREWTWEAHVPIGIASSLVAHESWCITKGMYDQFKNWLDDPDATVGITDDVLSACRRWVTSETHCVLVDEDKTPLDAISETLSQQTFD